MLGLSETSDLSRAPVELIRDLIDKFCFTGLTVEGRRRETPSG